MTTSPSGKELIHPPSVGLAGRVLYAIKYNMKTLKAGIAAAEIVLIFPAVLFFTALFARSLQPVEYEPAHTAQRIVIWYSTRPVWLGLWTLLMALPLAVLVLGCATLIRGWQSDAELRQALHQVLAAIRAHLSTLLVAGATLAAASILLFVAAHALTD